MTPPALAATQAAEPEKVDPTVAEFQRIDAAQLANLTPDQKLDLVIDATMRTHDCVHRFQADTARQLGEAREKRHQLSNSMMAMEGAVDRMAGSVEALAGEVGGLKAQRVMDSAQLDKVAKVVGAEPWKRGEPKIKPKGIGQMSLGKAAAAGLSVITGSVVVYRIIEPLLEPVIRSLHHILMTVRLG